MGFFLDKKWTKIFVIGILILACLNLFEKDIKNFFYSVSAPLQQIFFIRGKNTAAFLAVFTKTKEIQKQNQDLLLENQFLKTQIISLQELKKENQALQQALGLELQKNFQLLSAQVTFWEQSQDFILIDKGLEHNILLGQAVITPQKTLIGKVAEVFQDFSRIKLISDKSFSFPGRIQDAEFDGIVKGTSNQGLVFDLIPQDAEIQIGQAIVTVNLDRVFPGGILVGEIQSIVKSDLEPFQKAKIRPAFDLKTLDFLFIIMSEANN